MDEHDQLYLLSQDDSGSLLALDASLTRLRWAKRGLKVSRYARVVASRGVVGVVDQGAPALVYRGADGESLGTFPPRDSRHHASRVFSAAIQPDPTWVIAVSVQDRGYVFYLTNDRGDVLEGAEEGAFVPLRTLGGVGAVVRQVQEKVTIVGGLGDGVLLAHYSYVAKMRRDWTLSFILDRPRKGDWDPQAVALDAAGNVLGLTSSALVAFDRTGMLVSKIDRGGLQLGKEERVAVGKSGVIALAGSEGKLRVLRPDRTVAYVSEASAAP
jgi:hypothetical protein